MDPNTKTETEQQTENKVHENDTPLMAEFRNKVLNKPVLVTLADQRKIFGKLTCVDKHKNLVVTDAVEEIPDEYIAKINEKLPILTRSAMKIQNYFTLPEEIINDKAKLKEIEEQFFKNKFYLGQAIIPGFSITKVEIQKL